MEYFTKNSIALHELKTKFKGKVDFIKLSDAMIKELKKTAEEVNREESEKSPMAKKVHASYTKFQNLVGEWSMISEGSYYSLLG
jgi:TRAP-type mannitol/chloroaromatic compound transport system substrate-binding protein